MVGSTHKQIQRTVSIHRLCERLVASGLLDICSATRRRRCCRPGSGLTTPENDAVSHFLFPKTCSEAKGFYTILPAPSIIRITHTFPSRSSTPVLPPSPSHNFRKDCICLPPKSSDQLLESRKAQDMRSEPPPECRAQCKPHPLSYSPKLRQSKH